ncbi:MAK10-like protein [Tanacetum coccineum]
MGDENHIRTLGDYSKPSHEGYRNTIELPARNNVLPLQSDTIRLVQNGCSFYGLWSEDPNQHLKDFLKLVDSLDLDGANRERTRLQSLSEAWTHFKDLLQKVPHHDIDRCLQIQFFYDHEIIENLALYDHEGWNDMKEFVKPVKAISTPQGISKSPDRRLLELEDQINFLLKGSRPTPRSSTYIPYAYADAVYSNPRPQSHNEPPKLNPFTFCEHTSPSLQPQALGTSFEARVRDYMAAHSERMERFKNTIFKQREEINDRMTKMFELLKELTTSRTLEKVLIREEAKFSITKNVNSISLARREEEKSDKTDETLDNTVKPTGTETGILVKEAEGNNETENKPIEKAEIEEVDKWWKFNDSLSRARAGKVKGNTYNVLPRGPVYEAILKKKIIKKEDIRGNFEIPCSIRGLKHVNALVDQGSDVNVMPYSTYMKLTNERPTEINIRLLLASHSYIYHLGIAKDVLVEVAEHVYPIDFVILDIKENEKRPFIIGTPFLTTAKAVIKFDKGTITLRSRKS